jgi:pimeloyl-ACP methyl ester carboxylesterase
VFARPRPRTEPPSRGTVLFVHGLWMSGAESFLIRRRLAARGWTLRVLQYSSFVEDLDSVARRCARQAHALARSTEGPVHLLGHSLGGLVIYRAFQLGLLQPDRFSGDFCRVVFMGSPVSGSQSARVLWRNPHLRRLLGQTGGACLPDGMRGRWDFAAQLGIIAGTSGYGLGRLLAPFDGPNDGTVSVAETQMDGATDRCELPVTHTSMWLSAAVVERVANFLEAGRFG